MINTQNNNITIVTPSYNTVQYLPILLRNIAGIKSINIEHIVVDGGSNDGTIDVLKEHSSLYNLRWISGKDAGQYDAINKGFDMASNELVGYQNTDDLYFEDGLLKLITTLNNSPKAVGGYGNYIIIDETGAFRAIPHNTGPFDYGKLRRGNYIFPGSFFVRKSELDGIRFDHSLGFYGDWEWLLQLAITGKHIINVPAVVSAFRIHDCSKTSTWTGKSLSTEWEYISNKHNLNKNIVLADSVVTRVIQRLGTEYKKLTGKHIQEYENYEPFLKALR